MKKVNVSFIVPVRNEERNLARCLASCSWADEIFVVDSHSIDETAKIAADFGAKVVQFDFNGRWPKKKNWALDTLSFANDWVFILDADEVLPPEAELEIRAVVDGLEREVVGYWINRRFMFMGQWLKHAYYPNWNLRLFRHAEGRFEKLTDVATDSGDNEVHEHVIVKGKTGRLKSEMDHYAFPDVATFIEKHNRYSNWEARVAIDKYLGQDAGKLQMRSVGLRRWVKNAVKKLPFRPALRFIFVYFVQGGIWDGKAGFYFARLHGVYELLCIAKEYELRANSRS